MKTGSSKPQGIKTRERKAPSGAGSARKLRRIKQRAALKELAQQREHDPRAVKFKALGR